MANEPVISRILPNIMEIRRFFLTASDWWVMILLLFMDFGLISDQGTSKKAVINKNASCFYEQEARAYRIYLVWVSIFTLARWLKPNGKRTACTLVTKTEYCSLFTVL